MRVKAKTDLYNGSFVNTPEACPEFKWGVEDGFERRVLVKGLRLSPGRGASLIRGTVHEFVHSTGWRLQVRFCAYPRHLGPRASIWETIRLTSPSGEVYRLVTYQRNNYGMYATFASSEQEAEEFISDLGRTTFLRRNWRTWDGAEEFAPDF